MDFNNPGFILFAVVLLTSPLWGWALAANETAERRSRGNAYKRNPTMYKAYKEYEAYADKEETRPHGTSKPSWLTQEEWQIRREDWRKRIGA